MIVKLLLAVGAAILFLLLLLLIKRLRILRAGQAEAAERYGALFRSVADAVLVYSIGRDGKPGHFIEANDSALNLVGFSKEELLAKTPDAVALAPGFWDDPSRIGQLISDGSCVYEQMIRSARGRNIPVRISSCIFESKRKKFVYSTVYDLTEKKRLESEIRQAQRMESIGRLAGGVAHDFNNILTVINGYTDLMINTMTQENQFYDDVIEIRDASERAVSLTQQLLAFSRKQVLRPRPLSPRELLEQANNLLRRVIGEHIELEVDIADKVGTIHADPAQLEQVIINLAVNS